MESDRWERISSLQFIAFIGACAVFFAVLFTSEPGFMFGLDHANLLFHEAGHPIAGLFSARLETYGGTIGQLAFPILLVISFWRKGQPLSVAGSLIWFFENWLNIARYLADARALQLPLVGGGDHDWNTILTRWNILEYDLDIARWLRGLAWAGMTTAILWAVWRFARDRNSPATPQQFPDGLS